MARPTIIEDQVLIDRVSEVFKTYGYSGASLTSLATATGLKKASLYHRYPEGKKQMAREVLDNANTKFYNDVIGPTQASTSTNERVAKLIEGLSVFYDNGESACLLNVFSASTDTRELFSDKIKLSFEYFIDVITEISIEAGHKEAAAKKLALSLVAELQGSLVISRATGTNDAFKQFVTELPSKIII